MWDSLIQWVLGFLVQLGTSNPLVHLILVVLGILVVTGQALVAITPTTADDEFWAKVKSLPLIGQLIVMLANFAPFHKD